MALLNKIVSSGLNESKINKRLNDYAYKANIEAKKIKSDVRKPKQSIHGKPSSLLYKIVQSSINENKAAQRAQQTAYAAINGQRQQEYQTPEGVTMLGQLNREKPLTAITKEMIKEYQEEQEKPVIIDREARKYMKSDYKPDFPVSFENLKTTDEIDSMIERYRQGRTDTSNEIKSIDDDIKDTNDYIIALKQEIDEKGSNFRNLNQLRAELLNIDKLKKERKNLEKEIDRYDYDLKNLDKNRNEILKYNALLNQENREEVKKYEQSLAQQNRNRLNLQQKPYES